MFDLELAYSIAVAGPFLANQSKMVPLLSIFWLVTTILSFLVIDRETFKKSAIFDTRVSFEGLRISDFHKAPNERDLGNHHVVIKVVFLNSIQMEPTIDVKFGKSGSRHHGVEEHISEPISVSPSEDSSVSHDVLRGRKITLTVAVRRMKTRSKKSLQLVTRGWYVCIPQEIIMQMNIAEKDLLEITVMKV